MRPHPDLLELERCLDERRAPCEELQRRIERDPHLRRRARALRGVHAQLGQVLRSRAASGPTPPVAERVLARLAPPPHRFQRFLAPGLATAAAAALLAVLAIQVGSGTTPGAASAQADGPQAPAADVSRLLHWRAPLEPLPLSPEAALVAEARKLADDTRQVASSLLSRMPLASWLARDDELVR